VTAPLVLEHPRRVALLGAELVANRLRARPRLRLLLPPAGLDEALRAHAADGSLPVGQATLLAAGEHPNELGFGTVHGLDGAPVDLAVLGLGNDGANVAPPTLLGARELIVLALGEERAGALHALLEGELGAHPRLTVICDAGAASLLRPPPGRHSDGVLVVLGHRDPGLSPDDRVSDESWARLRLARRLAEAEPPRAVILTGYSRTPDGLSEAEQMKTRWSDGDAPALLEDAGRNTAENASRSLPLIRAIGDVRRVTVVTSAWHLRAPYFFAPYRLFGLKLSFAWTRHGDWGRMLAHEFHEAPAMRRERRSALAAMRLPAELALPRAEA
jgi:DUF218 domain